MNTRLVRVSCLVVLAVIGLDARAQTGRTLRVATKIAEPFVMKDSDGSYHGISVELWSAIAAKLGLRYEMVESDIDEMIEGVADGSFDAAVAALSVTAERETLVDFSHGYFSSGLGIAVRTRPGGVISAIEALYSTAFLAAVGALGALLLAIGIVVWLAERKRNPEQFGGSILHGIGSGFWFSAVTMTTVGYGDKAPRSIAGRIVSGVWMFAAILLISTFTGAIASALTTSQLDARVRGASDLPNVVVGAREEAVAVATLLERGARPRLYASVEDGLEALEAGEIDAFVHDAPLLQYMISRQRAGRVRVLDARFDAQHYGIALPEGSPLREPVNRVLLEVIGEAQWEEIVARYLR